MKIENIATGKEYNVTKEGWESLGNKKKAFKVVDFSDSDDLKDQTISNKVGTGFGLKDVKEVKESAKDSKKDGKESKHKTKF